MQSIRDSVEEFAGAEMFGDAINGKSWIEWVVNRSNHMKTWTAAKEHRRGLLRR